MSDDVKLPVLDSLVDWQADRNGRTVSVRSEGGRAHPAMLFEASLNVDVRCLSGSERPEMKKMTGQRKGADGVSAVATRHGRVGTRSSSIVRAPRYRLPGRATVCTRRSTSGADTLRGSTLTSDCEELDRVLLYRSG